MSLLATAGLWDSTETNNDTSTKKTRRNTSSHEEVAPSPPQKGNNTFMGPIKYPDTNTTASDIIKKINSIAVQNSGEKLTKFEPLTPPILQAPKKDDSPKPPANVVKTQNLGDIYSNYGNSYKESLQNIGLETLQTPKTPQNGGSLLERINYAIFLLEEQRNQRTEYLTEEFILYGLIGVFVIYLVDSFNKKTKYTR